MSVRLSVIVPVYGTEKYLRTCLDSLASQTMRDAEFLLVDDASPDRSDGVMQEYVNKDPRFRILHHERNMGLYAARMTGIRAAAGEYIAFMDSDDYVSVDFYRAAIAHADEGDFEVVLGDTVWVEADGSFVTRPVHADLLPEEPLYGEDVRRAFYAQEMSCYSWHTVWNKVYRRSLFERCMSALSSLTAHVVMTEDIAFSCVLLYEAASLSRIRGDGVFYCMHPASSTNAAYADEERFFKNYGDIVTVFEHADRFLAEKRDEEARAHLMQGRIWYCRMWAQARKERRLKGEPLKHCEALTARLAPGFDADAPCDNADVWWFDRHTVPWNDGLERIKRAIAGLDGKAPKVVSFDVFDTLIQRPFRSPDDLFCMLEDTWQQANRRCMLSFAAARTEAEASARAWLKEGRNEVCLKDIYDALRLTCGVSEDCAETMCRAEQEAELAFCRPRKTGVALYRMAKALGYRVALISDMYLDRVTITAMLQKCGVNDWDAFFLSNEEDALKWNGGLYKKALSALDIPGKALLHIGDHWQNDCLKPRELGIRAMHQARAMDVLTDRNRTALGCLGLQSAASFGGDGSLQGELSFRCMQALAANRFFDDGYAPTAPDSFFSASPARMGYYAVGGHILAVARWLIDRCRRDGVKRLIFLARDGWLVREAVRRLLPEDDALILDYQPASRRSLLPALTAHPSDFYALPVNVTACSVQQVIRLLHFCTKEQPEDELRRDCETAGFDWQQPFPGRYRYAEFIRWYLENLYDGRRHQQAINILHDYWEPLLTEGTACFDMGYSGRLQAALSRLAGRGVPVYFIHRDGRECPRLSAAYEYETTCFYGMKPGMSGAFREFLLSSCEPPCTGFKREGEHVVPVYGKSEYSRAAQTLLRIVQENALRFVADYAGCFRGTMAERVAPIPLSMPFESLLRYLPETDLALFEGIRFEDTVFAGRDDLDLAALIRDQSAAANAGTVPVREGMVGFIPSETPLIKRTVGFLLFDRALLKRKARSRLEKHPRLMRMLRPFYRGLKRLRALKKKGVR